MGRSVTPTFRVETTGTIGMTPACWNTKSYGRPSEKTAREYVEKFNESLEPGKCNEHIRKAYPNARMTGAKIIRQSTGEVVASYAAPMFQVVS